MIMMLMNIFHLYLNSVQNSDSMCVMIMVIMITKEMVSNDEKKEEDVDEDGDGEEDGQ